MKHRTIVLALASATLPLGAQAAEDFCSRVIVQALSQFCQLLPNGLNLCQPVALIGTAPECATPGRQVLVRVGPATLRPPFPGTAAPWTASPLPTPPVPAPDLPRIMAQVPTVKPAAAAPASTPPLTIPATLVSTPPVTPSPVAIASPITSLPVPAVPTVPATPIAGAVTKPVAPIQETMTVALVPAAKAPLAAEVAAAEVAKGVAKEVAKVSPVSQIAPASSSELAVTSANTATTMDALAHFDFDSAHLTTAGRTVLDTWLRKVPKSKMVRVSGHTDRLGSQPYNLKLSLRRAEAVKQYLVDKGVNARLIQIKARGKADPVKHCKGGATPATKACLAPNRRAVVDPE